MDLMRSWDTGPASVGHGEVEKVVMRIENYHNILEVTQTQAELHMLDFYRS